MLNNFHIPEVDSLILRSCDPLLWYNVHSQDTCPSLKSDQGTSTPSRPDRQHWYNRSVKKKPLKNNFQGSHIDRMTNELRFWRLF